MNLMTNVVCPISTRKIDSNVSRLSTFTLVLLMALFLVTYHPIWLFLVAIGYAFRALGYGQYSILTIVYSKLMSTLNISPKYIDKGQKVFAARLGFLCSAAGLVLVLLGFNTAAATIIILLATLSSMDSVFDFCLGCLIYNYLVLPFYQK